MSISLNRTRPTGLFQAVAETRIQSRSPAIIPGIERDSEQRIRSFGLACCASIDVTERSKIRYLRCRLPNTLCPAQPSEDRASHDPVLVLLGHEVEFLGKVGDALPVRGFGERIRDVGAPVAASRTVRVEHSAQVRRHVTEWIRFGRIRRYA